jgi:DNA-binding MarR family transcriptional regulator
MTPMPDHVFTVQSEYHKLMLTVELVLKKDGHTVNPAAGLMLALVGTEALAMTEIVKKRYYIGFNPSYNIRHLEQDGYIVRVPVRHDKRRKLIRLTPKGRELADQIRIALGGSAQKRVAA